jgi:hypothetical protein
MKTLADDLKSRARLIITDKNDNNPDLFHMCNNISEETNKALNKMSRQVANLLNPTPPFNENLELMKTLNMIVDDYFGIYMARPTEDTAYITFLPEDKLAELIPSEYAPKLNDLAGVFSDKINRFAAEVHTFDSISDDLSQDEQEEIVKKRFKKMLKSYKEIYGVSVQSELKRIFGIRTDASPNSNSGKHVSWDF